MASLHSEPVQRCLLSSSTNPRSKHPSPFTLKFRSFPIFLTLSPVGHSISLSHDLSKLCSASMAELIAHSEPTSERRSRHSSSSQVEERVGRNGEGKRRMSEKGALSESTARKSKKMQPWVRRDKEKEEERRKRKASAKHKPSEAETELRIQLDMCSKNGDVMDAIALYDSAVSRGIKLQQYHYNVLLYLCSSAAIGVIHSAKSGSRSGPNSSHDLDYLSDGSSNGATIEGTSEGTGKAGVLIQVSEEIREYARTRGLGIYEEMCSEKIAMSEAALTSVARMAMSIGDGDMAFEIVKQMKHLGITPRLRSYCPALLTFCNNGDVDKAFQVEVHMSESGIQPEEPELEALLRASIAARRGDKVYYLLHKLRINVKQVSPSTAELIEEWFKSSTASRVGKRKWVMKEIAEAMEKGGGGWHGQGWLGKGKWKVSRTSVDADGVCIACGEKLVTVDLDPVETEHFAKSVASLANKREKNSSFQKFQRWLDYYGPFEAVVDAANVGLSSQKRFSINRVNAVVNAIRQKLPMKRCPLIILHNKRLTEAKMDEPMNIKILEKWRNADAIYETPTGSNDDWYWLYAAISCKCLIVTNDAMRDHIFQVLGNDFFPKWKERHQVHFQFLDGSFDFHMPPPCSIVIQENERGHWHIPISTEQEQERDRTWLCVTRAHPHKDMDEASNPPIESYLQKVASSPASHVGAKNHVSDKRCSNAKTTRIPLINLTNFKTEEPHTIISEIEAAEKLYGFVIDFQI